MSAEATTPRMVFTNTNFEPCRLELATPKYTGDYARMTGYDGVEWVPGFYPAETVGRAIAEEYQMADGSWGRELVLNSLQQGAYVDSEVNGIVGHAYEHVPTNRLLSSTLGRLAAAKGIHAAHRMRNPVAIAYREIRENRGGDWGHQKVPGVFYPHPDPVVDARMRTIADAGVDLAQPSDHLARLLRVGSVESLTTELLERGYGTYYEGTSDDQFSEMPYSLNTFTMRRRYGRDNPGVVSAIGQSLSHIVDHAGAVQVDFNLGKLASKEPHINTKNELRSVLDGRVDGELKDIFAALREAGNVRYVVVAATATAIEAVTGHTKVDDMRQNYTDIATVLFNELQV